IPLCAPCHLAVHQTGQGNVSPGQLCLFSFLVDDNATLMIVPNIQLFSLTSSWDAPASIASNNPA
ncbi:MAG TPA: hypothetical protein V6D14_24060, partial [Coleofasciculaceae cyanobacterium]